MEDESYNENRGIITPFSPSMASSLASSPPSLSDSMKRLFAIQGCLTTENPKSKDSLTGFDNSWIDSLENDSKFCEDPVPVSKKQLFFVNRLFLHSRIISV